MAVPCIEVLEIRDASVDSIEYMEIVHIELSLDTKVQEYVPNE